MADQPETWLEKKKQKKTPAAKHCSISAALHTWSTPCKDVGHILVASFRRSSFRDLYWVDTAVQMSPPPPKICGNLSVIL